MKRYLIVFEGKVNKFLLYNSNAKNIECLGEIDNICFCDLDYDTFKQIQKDKRVKSIELDQKDKLNSDPNNGGQSSSYAFDLTEAKRFHDEGITGKGVKVAILDSGIQKHVDLNLKGGFNAYDENVPFDRNLAVNHGTKVAGAIAMQNNDKGMIGIAPGVELYAVRIDDGKGAINRTIWSAQIKAIDWCIKNKMDAINCSFSSATESIARREAFKKAYEAGIAIFCSAGNTQPSGDETTRTIVYPSKYPFVVTTANINSDKSRYTTSSIGRGINFSNGGVAVNLTNIDNSLEVSDKYQVGTGTSYASPITMGMYALYKEKYGESREKTLQRMYVNSEKLGDTLQFGAGIPKYPNIEYINSQMRG